jgi:hypothetical protein
VRIDSLMLQSKCREGVNIIRRGRKTG